MSPRLSTACPKPPKKLKKVNKYSLHATRKRPIKKSGRVKPKKRSASEFARIYGSKKRVVWVKSLPCAVWIAVELFGIETRCEGPVVNAHTVTGGMGRKADAKTIAPLCHAHHVDYDHYRGLFEDDRARRLIQMHAAQIDARWQQREWCARVSRSGSEG